uniref:Uncharacterized protein n=1 Tax=Streptomyces fradiae TaxID=1906 RepID=Q4A4B2_STRFR|nr:hypothetical protein [Streptomyces fradiae ATCC 10745 = DSM 40063]CAH05109.1 hypothetical protein [Streptomyces fradiae ATCC 10745 = DSM 40063]
MRSEGPGRPGDRRPAPAFRGLAGSRQRPWYGLAARYRVSHWPGAPAVARHRAIVMPRTPLASVAAMSLWTVRVPQPPVWCRSPSERTAPEPVWRVSVA